MSRLNGLRSVAARNLSRGLFVEFKVRPKHLGEEEAIGTVMIFTELGMVTTTFADPSSPGFDRIATMYPVDTTAFFSRTVKADDLIPIQS